MFSQNINKLLIVHSATSDVVLSKHRTMAPPDDAAPATPATNSTPSPTPRHDAPTNTTTPTNIATPTNTNTNPTSPTNSQTLNNSNANANDSTPNAALNTTEQQHPLVTGTTPPSAPRSTQRTTRQTSSGEEEQLFNVPNSDLASRLTADEYRTHVHELHAKLAGGNATDYVESKIALPRSLQGLRSGQVVMKVLALNPTLNVEDWSTVMAEVVGNNLILGTVTTAGRSLINNMNSLKLEPGGRTVTVPPATKPNNMYYVECLLPYERELHVDFLAAFLKHFPSAKHVSMPGKKAFGTTRRIRLYFHSTTAPREVFTPNDAGIPIREIILPCGSAAQIIHKWQRLNQVRPPHLLNRWGQQTHTRTYPPATIGAINMTTPPGAPRSYAQALANSANTNPQPSPTPQPLPPITTTLTPRADPIPHPDNTTTNTSQQQKSPNTTPTNNATPHPTMEWDSDEPFPPQQEGTLHEANLNPAQNTNPSNVDNTLSSRIPSAPITPPSRDRTTPQPTYPPASPQQPNTANKPTAPHTQGPNPGASQPPTATDNSTPANSNPTPTPPQKSNIAHPAPSRSASDLSQWQQVKRPRIRKPSSQAPSGHHPETRSIQKSNSRTRSAKAANKFAVLDYVIHPTFNDEDIAPIEIALPTKPNRPPRRKYKDTKVAITSQVRDALHHSQQTRHPAHTLTLLSPSQKQVVLCSRKQDVANCREKLIRQIALLRAARSNTTQRNILLDQFDDDAFINQLQTRMADCTDPPDCTSSTEIDLPLSAILDRDELRVRAEVCFAWVDLATRAVLPHLYDLWPDPPSWLGSPLRWLPAEDNEVPCLPKVTLAALAACPSLSNVWKHLSTSSPQLSAALQTAANQWHLHRATTNKN